MSYYISIVWIAVYCIWILFLVYGFFKIKPFIITKKTKNTTSFSLIVPFRNEAKNLPALLKSIAKLNYPCNLIEVILIDDFSTDASVSVYNKWRMQNGKIPTTLLENLRLTASPKKDAIARAIPIIKNKWIITTDADCVVPKNWLQTLDRFITETNAEMVAGSVLYKVKNNWFHHFQQLDLLGLQGTTIGSFGLQNAFMCNGANFAYTKKLFLDLNGFDKNSTFASGDDVFLLQEAVKKDASKVHFLKHTDFIVKTKPVNSLYALFMQRVRWASKTKGYNNWYAKLLAIVVFMANLILVIVFVFTFDGYLAWSFFWILFGLKYTADFILLQQANNFLQKGSFFIPVASAFVYPLFCSAVAIYSFFGKFEWKNRQLR
jgi:glycosyltransferase involved in cell wall biosynthesis